LKIEAIIFFHFQWTCIHDIQERDILDFTEQQNQHQQKDDGDVSPSLSSRFGDFAVEDFDDNQPQQPSRSGITSAFVIDSANRARIVQTMTPDSLGRSSSFNSRDVIQPNRPSRTSNWQEHSLRRSIRSNMAYRNIPVGRSSRASNFGVVVEVDDADVDSFSTRSYGVDRLRDVDDNDEELNHNPGNFRELSFNVVFKKI
jgi:WD repeat-containing protein 32